MFLSKVSDTAALAFSSLLTHKLRTFLTMLGIIFGVGAVISMMSIGAGAGAEAMSIIDAMGKRNIYVRAKEFEEEDLREIRKTSLGLSLRDAESLRKVVPGVEVVSAFKGIRVHKVLGKFLKSDIRVKGISPEYRELSNLKMASGYFFSGRDDRTFQHVCLIGSEAKRKLFGYEDAIGKRLKINNVWFVVVGILESYGFERKELEGMPLEDVSNDILVPVRTALKNFNFEDMEDELDEIIMRISEEYDVEEIAAIVGTFMSQLHGGEDDFEISIPVRLLEQSRRTQRIFNIVMGSIASLSLLVGGIGIMNIMLASVLERTSEIGLRRAVGARKSDIRNQFLAESVAISLCGGLLGILFGFGVANGVALFAGWKTLVTVSSIILSTGVAAAVGLIFGLYPATRAAGLDPIEALRHE